MIPDAETLSQIRNSKVHLKTFVDDDLRNVTFHDDKKPPLTLSFEQVWSVGWHLLAGVSWAYRIQLVEFYPYARRRFYDRLVEDVGAERMSTVLNLKETVTKAIEKRHALKLKLESMSPPTE